MKEVVCMLYVVLLFIYLWQLERLAKRLKKEKINVDIVSFGEEEENIEKLSHFIETINGTEQKESK